MEKKDILVVRVPERFNFDTEERNAITDLYENFLSNQFHVIFLWEENSEYKTQFEIIKC